MCVWSVCAIDSARACVRVGGYVCVSVSADVWVHGNARVCSFLCLVYACVCVCKSRQPPLYVCLYWNAQSSPSPAAHPGAVAGYKPPTAAADMNPEALKEAERLISERAEFARMIEVGLTRTRATHNTHSHTHARAASLTSRRRHRRPARADGSLQIRVQARRCCGGRSGGKERGIFPATAHHFDAACRAAVSRARA